MGNRAEALGSTRPTMWDVAPCTRMPPMSRGSKTRFGSAARGARLKISTSRPRIHPADRLPLDLPNPSPGPEAGMPADRPAHRIARRPDRPPRIRGRAARRGWVHFSSGQVF